MGRSPGRFGVIAVTSPDPVLSLLSALGLAQAAGSALVIDMCGDLTLASGRTLSDLSRGWPVRVSAQPRAVRRGAHVVRANRAHRGLAPSRRPGSGLARPGDPMLGRGVARRQDPG